MNANIENQIAKVQVSQSFVNTGKRPMEVCFVFPLPYDGAVDQVTLLVDGKEMPAKLMDAKEARKLYEEIVRKNRDPALLEWVGTGLFKTSVFPVPAGAERTVTLRYSQLCRKWEGLTDFIFPLSTAKYTSHPVEQVKLHLSLTSDVPLKNVYSPTHSVEIKRPDDKHATIDFSVKNAVPGEDFRLFYDVGSEAVGASVLSYRPQESEADGDKHGYFLLLASPQIKAEDTERPKKTVLIVLDHSGSMSGEKMEQAKGAAKFVINKLRDGDLFNVIAYDSEVTSWKPELQKFDDDSRKAALGFVEGIFAGGSTNIDAALTTALSQLQDKKQPSFVIFLTDGLPTVGERNEAKIVANAKANNKVRARIFDFGVGYDVNSRLLDKLARDNFGLSEYVRPNEDIERAVAALYNRIGSPVMTDVKITFEMDGLKPEEGQAASRVYPKDVFDLFAGEQLVLTGRYPKSGDVKIIVKGQVGEKEQKFEFPAKFVETSSDASNAFIEKLWAVRRVGEILDEIDLKGKNDELVKELVTLSLRHGIMTPYTSFLADENASPQTFRDGVSTASRRLTNLELRTEGQFGFNQRVAKGSLQRANVPAAAMPLSSSADAAARPALNDFYGAVADAKGEREKVAENVRHLGRKTFFRRGDRWVDSVVEADDEKQAVKIVRFSPEYFELIDKHGHEAGLYLSITEPLVVRLDGKVYELQADNDGGK